MQAADHTLTLFSCDFHTPMAYIRCQAALAVGWSLKQLRILADGTLCISMPWLSGTCLAHVVAGLIDPWDCKLTRVRISLN